jgi:hypothetical protein
MSIQFTGELWRQTPFPKTLAFHYVLDLTGTNGFDTNSADFVYLPNLDVEFATSNESGSATNVDGALPINQTTNAVANQAIAHWPPGAALWLVWEYASNISGAQGIGIDNLSFSATADTTGATITPPLLGDVTFIASGNGGGGGLNFSFTDSAVTNASFTVWSTTNIGLPFSQWQNLGQPTETQPGSYQFTYTQATNFTQQFFRVTSP